MLEQLRAEPTRPRRTAVRAGRVRSKRAGSDLLLRRSCFERMTDGVIALDAADRITYLNPAAESLYDVHAADVLQRPFRDVVSSTPISDAPDSPDAGLADGPAIHVTSGGRRIPVLVSLMDVVRRRAAPLRVAIIRDNSRYDTAAASLAERLTFEVLISELSARFNSIAEEEVDLEIERWLRRLVEFLQVDRSSFSEVAPGGRFSITHAFAVPGIELTPKGPVVGMFPWLVEQYNDKRTVKLRSIPDDLPDEAQMEREYFVGLGMTAGVGIPITIGQSLVCVLTFGSFRGPREWPDSTVSRLRLAGEVFANAIFRRQAKQRLDQKQRELTHFGRVAAMGELAAVIAHELDQPLTAVVSNAQAVRSMLASSNPDLPEVDEALKDVIDAAMRVSEITLRERRLLKNASVNFALVEINELVREMELFIRAEARQDGGNVSFELRPGLPMILADRIQLEQVILNLARNALQAMVGQARETRQLCIRTLVQSGEVVLAVRDSGPQVDDGCLSQMFDPFYTTKTSGLGMGLSISRSIVQMHRGRIWATRNPDHGLTMQVALPQMETSHAHH